MALVDVVVLRVLSSGVVVRGRWVVLPRVVVDKRGNAGNSVVFDTDNMSVMSASVPLVPVAVSLVMVASVPFTAKDPSAPSSCSLPVIITKPGPGRIRANGK